MFIWDDEYLNSHIPVLASSVMGYFNFNFLHNSFALCKMLRSNTRAIDYNKRFGYKICEGQEKEENQLYKLSREDYKTHATTGRSMLRKIYRDMDDSIVVELDEEDKANGVKEFIEKYYSKSSSENALVPIWVVQ